MYVVFTLALNPEGCAKVIANGKRFVLTWFKVSPDRLYHFPFSHTDTLR